MVRSPDHLKTNQSNSDKELKVIAEGLHAWKIIPGDRRYDVAEVTAAV